jgi:hypothetical protein
VKSSAAIDKAQAWLAQHQSRDGSWGLDGFMSFGDPKLGPLFDGKGGAVFDVPGTSLALLTLMWQGNTHAMGDFSTSIKMGLKYLIAV